MERIKCSAIFQDGVIYTGKRHNLIIKEIYSKTHKTVTGIQGFVTERDIFVTRDQAEVIARASGQLTKKLIGSILTSEDLW